MLGRSQGVGADGFFQFAEHPAGLTQSPIGLLPGGRLGGPCHRESVFLHFLDYGNARSVDTPDKGLQPAGTHQRVAKERGPSSTYRRLSRGTTNSSNSGRSSSLLARGTTTLLP